MEVLEGVPDENDNKLKMFERKLQHIRDSYGLSNDEFWYEVMDFDMGSTSTSERKILPGSHSQGRSNRNTRTGRMGPMLGLEESSDSNDSQQNEEMERTKRSSLYTGVSHTGINHPALTDPYLDI
ncbi:hypothetical protein AAMO2058_001188400 [Amorphochlora amoebiformis]